MAQLLKGGRIIDPARGIDHAGDLLVSGTVIADPATAPDDAEVIDAAGLWVVPGLIDAHVHLREPGGEAKEDIASGLASAAASGMTAVLAMPNTAPPNDSPEVTRMMIGRARELGGARLHPVPCLTVGRAGQELAPLAELRAAGAVAFSDDGSGLAHTGVMEAALIACRDLSVPLAQHSEDPALSAGGVVHEGDVSRELGLAGWPAAAEEEMLRRDLELLERVGGHLHVCHISTAGAVDLVRRARERGLRVTAEVTPHHLHLTDEVLRAGDTAAKVNPPLRPAEHVTACRHGLADGTIDMVATDHAPHTVDDKSGGFEDAAFGLIGMETAVPLLLELVESGVITAPRMIEAMSTAPARVFGLPGGTLVPGAIADVTLIDPASPHEVDPGKFRSRARNTPFAGRRVPGRAVRTIVAGRTVFAAQSA